MQSTTNASAEALTITLPPNLSAAVRFLAHVYKKTPEEHVLEMLSEPVSCLLKEGVYDEQEDWKKWLASVGEKPEAGEVSHA